MTAPSLQEIFVDPSTGLPLAGGTVTFYSDVNRSTLKPIYELSGSPGSGYTYNPISNPAPLSGGGTLTDGTNDILPYYKPYDSTGAVELYYIVVKNSAGQNIITRQAQPNFSTTTPTISSGYEFVRNGQFSVWSSDTTYPNIGLGSLITNLSDYIADDWYYTQNAASQTIGISQVLFPKSGAPIPGNPLSYLLYSSGGGTGQTVNKLYQNYAGITTLSGSQVAVSMWINQLSGATPLSFSCTLSQYFGSGGSPSATPTPVEMFLTSVITIGQWQLYVGTNTLPAVSGTLGTNGDDALQLNINFPFNQAINVGVCNVQLQQGASVNPIVQKSYNDVSRGTDYQTAYSLWYTGDVKTTISKVAPTGWLLMDDNNIGVAASNAVYKGLYVKALYLLLWANITSQANGTLTNGLGYAQMASSAGAYLGSVGASAEADWAAGNSIYLTQTLGRLISSSGTAITPNSDGTAWALGQIGGNEGHLQAVNELAAHNHPGSNLHGRTSGAGAGTGGGVLGLTEAAPTGGSSVEIGSSSAVQPGIQPNNVPTPTQVPFTLLNPRIAFNVMIKL